MEISKEELNKLIDLRIEERRKNRDMVSAILDEFKDKTKKFDYTENWNCITCDGNHVSRNIEHTVHRKIRSALSTIVRAHFKVNSVWQIPYDKVDDVRKLVSRIIEISLPREGGEEND